ncbi:MAG: hypothetical protein ABL974_17260 [Prosthecobacter sp.]
MTPPASSRTPAKPTRCRVAREWVQLLLGAAAGAAFIWQCSQPETAVMKCSLLLFLCLTFFGRMTVLGRLAELLKTWQAGAKP